MFSFLSFSSDISYKWIQAGSDAPVHRINDAMSLELHMGDERVRAAGLTPAEREWRM